MMLENVPTPQEPFVGKCQSCGFFTDLLPARLATGEMFLGNPVFDDLLICAICAETNNMTGDKLMRYLANLILILGQNRNEP